MRTTLSLALAVSLSLSLGFAGACHNPADDAPPALVTAAPPAAPAAAPAAATQSYVFSNQTSTVAWVGSKVTRSHDGGFNAFTGEISTDGTAVGTTVKVTIDTTSLWSDTEQLTGHLKSPDFFDVEQYPTASFTSSAIADGADGSYTVTGTLELHGVTKQVVFPARIVVSDSGVEVDAEFSINRQDWGIVYAGKADDLIRDEVLLKLDIQTAGTDAAAAPDPAAAPAPAAP